MFSLSYWLLYVPLLGYLVNCPAKRSGKKIGLIVCFAAAFLLHQAVYPAVVWLISASFYTHAYPYGQTFYYGISEYLFVTLLFYGAVCLFFIVQRGKKNFASGLAASSEEIFDSLLVSSGLQKIKIEARQIINISANYPYTTVYTADKQYLYNDNLRAVLQKLDPKIFVQVHKSHVVNIGEVVSFKSRLNGDYDLFLKNGKQLRLSRNYSAPFKSLFAEAHRLTC